MVFPFYFYTFRKYAYPYLGRAIAKGAAIEHHTLMPLRVATLVVVQQQLSATLKECFETAHAGLYSTLNHHFDRRTLSRLLCMDMRIRTFTLIQHFRTLFMQRMIGCSTEKRRT